jgi:hypothetical protein
LIIAIGICRNAEGEEVNMENIFFEKPILNSPYEYPSRHWELDTQGQFLMKERACPHSNSDMIPRRSLTICGIMWTSGEVSPIPTTGK